MSADKPDLHQRLLLIDATFKLEHVKEMSDVAGVECDLYLLAEFGETNGITLCLPKGYGEVADYIARCCRAGQAVLRQMPLDAPFIADQAKPNLRRQ